MHDWTALQTLDVCGRSTRLIDLGNGPGVLFLHGFPFNLGFWQNQIEVFAQHFRVLVPDLPGFGESQPLSGELTMRGLADWCLELLKAQQVEEPIHLVALSMGGYIGFELLRHAPEKFQRVVLCHTRAGTDSRSTRSGREQMASDVMANGVESICDAMLAKLFARANLREALTEVDFIRESILSTSRDGFAAGQRAMASREDASDSLTAIQQPTLVVGGGDDQITPSTEMKKWAARLPNGKYLEIPEAGHLSPLENAELFNRGVLRFLLAQEGSVNSD